MDTLIWLVCVFMCTSQVVTLTSYYENRNQTDCYAVGLRCSEWSTCSIDIVTNNAKCVCIPGIKGTTCREDVDECSRGTPCRNGGVCHNSVGSYRCDCIRGWHGSHCQSPGGSGLNTCRAGYTGVNCTEDFDECTQWPESPCEHNGTCVNSRGSFTCECPAGWQGRTCSDDINECHVVQWLCLNGGNCTNTRGSFTCICATGWAGPLCSKAVDVDKNGTTQEPCDKDPKGDMTLFWVIVASAGGLLVGGVSASIYITCVRKSQVMRVSSQLRSLRNV